MKYTSWIAIGGTLGIITFYALNPANHAFFPKCPFWVLTKYKCPGCGSQRAIHCLLHGDITSAFHYNALLVISLPFILLLLYAEIKRKSKPSFYIKLHRPAIIITIFITIIIWWVLRNLFNW